MYLLDQLQTRWRQGYRTIAYPAGPIPALPDRFHGVPMISLEQCAKECHACVDACPTEAIKLLPQKKNFELDLGKCLFCRTCSQACPSGAIKVAKDHRLSVRHKQDLQISKENSQPRLAAALDEKLRKIFGRSFKLRQVSSGGCNACEADVNVLSTIGWDIGRFGIQMVASPRHADGLLITGPVTDNMLLALQKSYEALPEPRVVIAVGSCAISGGPFAGHSQTHNGADSVVPVDLYIPGCPPHPLTILDGLLRLLGRLDG